MNRRTNSRAGFTLVELMVVVAIIGTLAATATPSFVDYLHSAKASEVHVTLSACYQAVLAYHQRPQAFEDGTAETSKLPGKMNKWVCPGKNFGKQADLDGSAQLIDPRVWSKKGAQAFADMGFRVTDATHACFRYDTSAKANKPLADGTWFRCQAMTDLDADGQYAYWYQTGTYVAATGSFQGGATYHLSSGDDW